MKTTISRFFMFCYHMIALIFLGVALSFQFLGEIPELTVGIIGKLFKSLLTYLLDDHPEEIEGEIIDLTERDEPSFYYFGFPTINYDANQLLQTYEIIPIHRYVLTLKKGVDLITVRVPLSLYKKLRKQIEKGIKHTSLICEKNQLENVYDFYDKQPIKV